MFLYFLFISLPICAHLFLPNNGKDKILRHIITFLLSLFFCFSYMNGSDWRQYETMYYNIDLIRPFEDFSIEFGYQLVSVVARFLNIDFWHFFISIKVLCFFSCTSFIDKYLPQYYFLGLFFFLCFFGPFLFIDAPFRNLIAVSIFLTSIPYLLNKEFFKYSLIILISFLFHYSSFFLFFIYPLIHRRFESKFIVILYLILNVFFIFFVDILKQLVVDFVSLIPFFTKKVGSYFVADSEYSKGSEFTIGNLLRILFFFLIIKFRDRIENKFGSGFFNLLVLYFILYRLAVSIVIFGRFTLYLTVIYSCGIAFLANVFPKKVRVIYSLAIILVSLLTYFVQLRSDYKYIPYTSYFEYIFSQKPDFNYRSNYNFIKSPYTREKDE